jgi:hypothetical protein
VAVSSGRRDNFVPTDSSQVCSIHFEESAFDRKAFRVNLRRNAVPTLFFVPTFEEEQQMIKDSGVTEAVFNLAPGGEL